MRRYPSSFFIQLSNMYCTPTITLHIISAAGLTNADLLAIISGYAGVAELADALDLGSSGTPVQVQVLSPAPYRVFLQDLKGSV